MSGRPGWPWLCTPGPTPAGARPADRERRARLKGSWAAARRRTSRHGMRRRGRGPASLGRRAPPPSPHTPGSALALPALCCLQGLPSRSWAGWRGPQAGLAVSSAALCSPAPGQPAAPRPRPPNSTLLLPARRGGPETGRDLPQSPSSRRGAEFRRLPPTPVAHPPHRTTTGPLEPRSPLLTLLSPPQHLRDEADSPPASEPGSAVWPCQGGMHTRDVL